MKSKPLHKMTPVGDKRDTAVTQRRLVERVQYTVLGGGQGGQKKGPGVTSDLKKGLGIKKR